MGSQWWACATANAVMFSTRRTVAAGVRMCAVAGVPIRINRHEALMHLKQVVIDDAINTSGSANHTTSGNRYNDERLDVITDARLTAKAREKFLTMWNDHERFMTWTQ